MRLYVCIPSNQNLIIQYIVLANKFLKDFVSPQIYDTFMVVYNVHYLTHICDHVRLYGPLENFSFSSYKSYLGRLKRTVRGKSLPLQQVNNRIVEMSKIYNSAAKSVNNQLKPYGIKKKLII